MAVYYRPDGSPSPYPTSKDSAKSIRSARYDDGNVCPDCDQSSIKYTKNDHCVYCAMTFAVEQYQILTGLEKIPTSPALAAEQESPVWVRPEPCSKAGHVGLRTLDGHCYECQGEAREAQFNPRADARKRGQTWYTPNEPCPYCHTWAQRRVNDNRCIGCHPTKVVSRARAEARRQGQTRYTPEQVCPHCHTRAQRRTSDDRCYGCHPSTHDGPRAEARRRGDRYYTPDGPCLTCGTLAQRRVQDDACTGCPTAAPTPRTSARQDAIDAGQAWYLPDYPCKHCGLIAERSVANGRCSGCRLTEMERGLVMTGVAPVGKGSGLGIWCDGATWCTVRGDRVVKGP